MKNLKKNTNGIISPALQQHIDNAVLSYKIKIHPRASGYLLHTLGEIRILFGEIATGGELPIFYLDRNCKLIPPEKLNRFRSRLSWKEIPVSISDDFIP